MHAHAQLRLHVGVERYFGIVRLCRSGLQPMRALRERQRIVPTLPASPLMLLRRNASELSDECTLLLRCSEVFRAQVPRLPATRKEDNKWEEPAP